MKTNTGTITEENLLTLRSRVASLYGEDIAQRTMIRVLSKEYRDYWFEKELLIARREWQRQEKQRLRFVSFETNNEEFESLCSYEDDDRISAWVELMDLCYGSANVAKLVKIELGIKKVTRFHESVLKREYRITNSEKQ